MKGIASLIAGLVLLVLQPSSAELCPGLEDTCALKVNRNYLMENGLFVPEDVLKDRCSDILEIIECQKNYLATCEISSHIPFKELSKGYLELLTEMCDETSELRADYRLYSPCIRRNISIFDGCVSSSLQQLRDCEDELGILDDNDRITERLCKFHELLCNCSIPKIKQTCGIQAAMLLDILLNKPVDELKGSKCPQS